MPNTKTAKARDLSNERDRQRNMAVKSKMKTSIKAAAAAIDAKNADEIKKTLLVALADIDRAATKGVIHANAAARRKSTLQRRAAQIPS